MSFFGFVVEKPTILTIPPSIITIREHERLQLPCECTGSPELRITWQLPRYHYISEGLWNVTMSSQQRSHQVIPNGTLILYIPSVDNNGIYTCVCENSAGVDTIQYNVYIWGKSWAVHIITTLEVIFVNNRDIKLLHVVPHYYSTCLS